jgi:hypothetical protein
LHTNEKSGVPSNELGRDTLARAMTWASGEIGHANNLADLVSTPH